MDSDSDGKISYQEFCQSTVRPEVHEYLDALEIDISHAGKLFTLLDQDGDGMVDLREFVEGMCKLKGEAKSSDIQVLMMQVNRIVRQGEALKKIVLTNASVSMSV